MWCLIKHKVNFSSTLKRQGEGKEWQKETWKTGKGNCKGRGRGEEKKGGASKGNQ
jgi:hypothetical protein